MSRLKRLPKLPLRKLPLWLLVLALCGAAAAKAVDEKSVPRVFYSAVERVIDGDTVVLAGGERVRYIGIDTPELHHPKKPIEAYAREAKELNRRLVEGKQVRVELDVEPRDRYGRLLGYVFREQDQLFVNAELLRQGYAQLLTIPPNVKYVDYLRQMQTQARDMKRGLWKKR